MQKQQVLQAAGIEAVVLGDPSSRHPRAAAIQGVIHEAAGIREEARAFPAAGRDDADDGSRPPRRLGSRNPGGSTSIRAAGHGDPGGGRLQDGGRSAGQQVQVSKSEGSRSKNPGPGAAGVQAALSR